MAKEHDDLKEARGWGSLYFPSLAHHIRTTMMQMYCGALME
jgi:hypothetical protein